MNKFIKIGEDADPIDSDEETSVEPEEAEELEPEEAVVEFKGSKATGMVIRAALKALDEGIDRGVDSGFASAHNKNISDIILDELYKVLFSVNTLSLPVAEMERRIKSNTAFTFTNIKINENARAALQRRIVGPAIKLYKSNFEPFMKEVEKNPSMFEGVGQNDTSILETLAIEYKAADTETRTTSDESPYKIILKKIIPILREKFDAVVSFKEIVGHGANIDYERIGDRFARGSVTSLDIDQLSGLFGAVKEWSVFLDGLNASGYIKSIRDPEDDEEQAEGEGSFSASIEEAMSNVSLEGLKPDENTEQDLNNPGLIVNMDDVSEMNKAVVKVLFTGEDVVKLNAINATNLLEYLIEKKVIQVAIPGAQKIREIIDYETTELTSEGLELTLYLNSEKLKEVASSGDSTNIFLIKRDGREFAVTAGDNSLLNELLKLSSSLGVTPLYETVSPSGESVVFTSTDLVMGGGSLRDSKGKKFKPKKRKGKSLADRVTSPGYGKVKRGLGSKGKK